MSEIGALVSNLPVQVWNSASAVRAYGRVLGLTCRFRSGAVVGAWVCPLDDDGDGRVAARRPARLLPYASPWIAADLHPSAAHRVVVSLVRELLRHVDSMELPMAPGFGEVAALLECGVDAPSRHTRVLSTTDLAQVRAGYLPQVRNHIRAASPRYTIESFRPDRFDFSRSVVHQSTEAAAARRRAGLSISKEHPALCLSAVDDGGTLRGQVFVLRMGDSAVLMHSWFDRAGLRGVPSLLVDDAIARSAEGWGSTIFDFEGSVIPTIDRFMAGFGARSAAYVQARSGQTSGSAAVFG